MASPRSPTELGSKGQVANADFAGNATTAIERFAAVAVDAPGARFDIMAWLQTQPADAVADEIVVLACSGPQDRLPIRLIVRRKSSEAIASMLTFGIQAGMRLSCLFTLPGQSG